MKFWFHSSPASRSIHCRRTKPAKELSATHGEVEKKSHEAKQESYFLQLGNIHGGFGAIRQVLTRTQRKPCNNMVTNYHKPERAARHFSEQDLQLEVEQGAPEGQTAVSLTLKRASVCKVENAYKHEKCNLAGMTREVATPCSEVPI
jgi:hypothetical protein